MGEGVALDENGGRATPEDHSSAEHCEVDYEVEKRGGLLAARWRFVAWVVGPAGRRALARSPVVYGHPPEIQRSLVAAKALDALAAVVAGAGWVEIHRGERWYSLRFRRGLESTETPNTEG